MTVWHCAYLYDGTWTPWVRISKRVTDYQ